MISLDFLKERATSFVSHRISQSMAKVRTPVQLTRSDSNMDYMKFFYLVLKIIIELKRFYKNTKFLYQVKG